MASATRRTAGPDPAGPPPDDGSAPIRPLPWSARLRLALYRHDRHRDAGFASYVAGLLAAAAFAALSSATAWPGLLLAFLLAFLPATALTAWAMTAHGHA
jgi:hypothetical protein